MTNIRAIFLDFDWTLFDHKTRSFNEKGIYGLNKVHDKGIKLIINSARSYYALKNLKTFELIPLDGFIVANGGAAMIDGKCLYANFFNNKIKNEFINLLDENNYSYNLVGQFDTYIKNTNEDLVKSFYEVFYEPYPKDISTYKNEDILAVQVFCKEDNESLIKTFCQKYNLLFNRFAENNVEITSKEFLKSEGVKAIYDYLRLSKEEAMAFGDDVNDIPMFNSVKYSVCLGNGKEEAKKQAFYVTDTIENDGLYKALKHFELVD